jgi:hypothetical protein
MTFPGFLSRCARATGRHTLASHINRRLVGTISALFHATWKSSGPFGFLAFLALALLAAGCACPRAGMKVDGKRPFDFQRDTFAFPNGLRWVYEYDADGKWTTHTRYPQPDYSQHCFVVARSARQFFLNAEFDPWLPKTDERTYRRLIDKVVATNPRHPLVKNEKIVIPGYADLREFSVAHPDWLKHECGGAWQSYFQRGHWRIMMPFSRGHREHTAGDLLAHARAGDAVVVHLVRFPQLTINHAVVVFAADDQPERIVFTMYDPNLPSEPRMLYFNKQTSTFEFPANNYFPGGKVNVYEVYNKWNY